jgi:organic hydroperoxide reductase OsmC/OhrA
MSTTATYHTTVNWVAGHEGRVHMGNGPEMAFSAPPDAHGLPDVLTPEDAFVGAVNTCIMLMFLWACERFQLELLAYECRAEGTKLIELDRTETFTTVRLRPRIRVSAGDKAQEAVRRRVERALADAEKYSLVANSVRSRIVIEPEITIEAGGA